MSAPDFAAAGAWVIDQLKAAGVRASMDPAKVNPPGVWAQPANARPIQTLADAWEVDLNLYAVVGNVAADQAFGKLGDLVEQLAIFNPRGDLEVVTLELPGAPGVGLPAIRYPIRVQTP